MKFFRALAAPLFLCCLATSAVRATPVDPAAWPKYENWTRFVRYDVIYNYVLYCIAKGLPPNFAEFTAGTGVPEEQIPSAFRVVAGDSEFFATLVKRVEEFSGDRAYLVENPGEAPACFPHFSGGIARDFYLVTASGRRIVRFDQSDVPVRFSDFLPR